MVTRWSIYLCILSPPITIYKDTVPNRDDKKYWIPTVEPGNDKGGAGFPPALQIPRPCQLRWRDCSSCASSFIPFALSGSHYRCAPRIAPLTLRGISLCALHKGQFNLRCELRKARSTTARCAWYNSSSKLQYTLFLKLGSHYQRMSLRRIRLGLTLSW